MSISSKPRIIGLSGTFASGKDTLAHYLVQHYHYLHISTGDMVRQEALKQRGSIERPVLHEVADSLRRSHGAGVLADLAIKMFEAKQAERDDYKGLVVSGLRSLGEAKAIKAAGGVLVFTDAPLEIRYERMRNRKRDDETTFTLEEFRAQEMTELETTGEGDEAFNILGIKNISDIILLNNTDLESYIHQATSKLGF